MTFLARPDLSTCVVMLKKAGSSSFYSAIHNSKKGLNLTNEEAIPYSKRVMFIRNPLARHHSAFSFFWWLKADGHVTDVIDMGVFKGDNVQEDYEAFVDYSLENENGHWNSQIAEASFNGEFIPNRVHRFEDLQTYWEEYFTGLLPWSNAFSKVQVDEYRREDLIKFYTEDITLWENLNDD